MFNGIEIARNAKNKKMDSSSIIWTCSLILNKFGTLEIKII